RVLHWTECNSHVHPVGRRISESTRSHLAATTRNRWRTDQSGSLGLVSHGNRRRPLSHRRHLVANRDRCDHDYATSWSNASEAWDRNAPVFRRRRGGGG